jgi:carbon-monoxide dehydrogenase medium subunit
MIPPFTLHQPTTVAEASALASQLDDSAFYNGGTELTLLLKMGLAQFEHLIDLKQIGGLRDITVDGADLRIGGAATHADIERSPLVRRLAPGLAGLEKHLANVRVRNTGTLAGNLCFAEPHSDPAVFLMAWGAKMELVQQDATRVRPVEGFALGALETDKQPDEVMTAVLLPALAPNTSVVHEKVAFIQRPAASIGVRLSLDGGQFNGTRIAVGSVGELPQMMPTAAAAVEGTDRGDAAAAFQAAADAAAQACEPFEDLNGSVEYKRRLVRVLVQRALHNALQEIERDAKD